MAVHCDEYPGVTVITVNGDLCAPEANAVRDTLARTGDRGTIVFDLERCRFLSSQGLEALLQAHGHCQAHGARALLAGLDSNCRKILEITRLDTRFECHAHLAEALKVTTNNQ
ncbi:MAG TPA: STAS domain-containing protein [Tepidisphaeraceae bacterium]|nr:STAS domain-containing protein [Tepidisphaeraceae bacterium]